MSKFVLRIDDVAPGMAWGNLEFLQRALVDSGVTPIVGVVPDCQDPTLNVQLPVSDFWNRVRLMRDMGWAIAQHGFTHVYDTESGGLLRIGSKSEFAGHRLDEQRRRLRKGKDILVSQDCWQPYFMAPSHSFDDNTLRALVEEGFLAITDGYGLYPYPLAGLTAVPQLFSRPITVGPGIYTICLHLNSMDEQSLEHMASFIRSRRSEFIGFEDAVGLAGEHRLMAAVSRGATSAVLRCARVVRTGGRRVRAVRTGRNASGTEMRAQRTVEDRS